MTDERKSKGPPPLPGAEPADSNMPTEQPPPSEIASRIGAAPLRGQPPARLGRSLLPGELDAPAKSPRTEKTTLKLKKSSLPLPSAPRSAPPSAAPLSAPKTRPSAPPPVRPSAPPPPPTSTRPSAPMKSARPSAPPPPPLLRPSAPPPPPPRPTPSRPPSVAPRPTLGRKQTPATQRITDAAIHARLNALEADLKEARRGTRGKPSGDLGTLERRIAKIEALLSPSFRTLPARVDALETSVSTRIDQAMSAVGRMEIFSARLEESEESLGERLDILEARGEGLERRLKDATGAGGVAEWREEITSLRKEMKDIWAAEVAAQPWLDEIAALRDELLEVRTKSESGTTAAPSAAPNIDALQEELEAIKKQQEALEAKLAAASLEQVASLNARVAVLESVPPPPAATDLTTIKGIGPKYARALESEGVQNRAAVAALDDPGVERLAEALGIPVKRVQAWRKNA